MGASYSKNGNKDEDRFFGYGDIVYIKYNAEIYNGRKGVVFSVYRGATKHLLISWTNCNLNNAKMFQSVFLSFIETAVTLKHKMLLGVGTDLGVQDIYGVTVLVRAGRLGGEEVDYDSRQEWISKLWIDREEWRSTGLSTTNITI